MAGIPTEDTWGENNRRPKSPQGGGPISDMAKAAVGASVMDMFASSAAQSEESRDPFSFLLRLLFSLVNNFSFKID